MAEPYKSDITPDEVFNPPSTDALMDGVGLTQEKLIAKISEKLSAMETVFAKFEGRITEKIDVQAHDIQLRALDMALKLRRMYPDPKLKLDMPGEFKFMIVPPDGADE